MRGKSVGFVLLLAALLRLPAFAWTTLSDDASTYAALAATLQAGGTMYHDAVDHKPPGLAYTYAAITALTTYLGGDAMQGVHALGLLVLVATVAVLARLARAADAKDGWAWAPLAYAFCASNKVAFDALAVNGELLMNLPAIVGVAAAQRAASRRPQRSVGRHGWDWLAGAAVAVASLYKWQAILTLVALPTAWGHPPARQRWRMLAHATWIVVGLVSVMALVAAYFAHRGVLAEAWHWGFLFNRRYIAQGPPWDFALRRLGQQLVGCVLPALPIYGAGIWALGRGRTPWPLAAWLGVSALAVGIGGRFFGHYFLQLELPLALVAAPVLARWWRRWPVPLGVWLALPSAAFFLLACMPQWHVRLFGAGQPNWSTVGRAVAGHADATDTLFVWGNAPQIYTHAKLAPGTRFVFCNYLTGLSPATPSESDPNVIPAVHDAHAWQALWQDLRERQPTWLLDTATPGWKGYDKFSLTRFAPLADYVRQHYRLQDVIEGAPLYRRVGALGR